MPDTLEAPIETPAVEAPPVAAEPKEDPWTSQSAETPAVEAKADDEPAAVEPAPAERNESGQFQAKTPSKRKNPYEAVKAATGETAREREAREKAEARAADLERQLEEARRPKLEPALKAEPASGDRKKPSEDEIGTKYASYADFVEDLADWKAEQRLKANDVDARIAARFEAERRQQAQDRRDAALVESGKQAYPDFVEVINSATLEFPTWHGEFIKGLPNAHDVIYALAKDLETAKHIATIDNPFALGVALAQLVPPSGVAARPDSTSPARSSTAKPPINRVGGTASAVPVDPDDLEFGPDFIRAENEKDRKRKQANRWG